MPLLNVRLVTPVAWSVPGRPLGTGDRSGVGVAVRAFERRADGIRVGVAEELGGRECTGGRCGVGVKGWWEMLGTLLVFVRRLAEPVICPVNSPVLTGGRGGLATAAGLVSLPAVS